MSNPKTRGPRYREASEDNRKILEGIRDPELRRQYLDTLLSKEWVVFTPREVDFRRFSELLERDGELRGWIENEPDPVLIAELLCRNYPQVFLTIEHAYSTTIDWKIEQTRKRAYGGGSGGGDRPPIPGHLFVALSDDELHMVARRQLRKWVKALNRDAEGAINDLSEAAANEQDVKQRQVLEYLMCLAVELSQMKFPAFVSELIPGVPFPSMHVRVWIKQIIERGSALIVGDVGTQKTSAAVIGLEQLGARRVCIVCRSNARDDVWANELRRYYRGEIGSDPFVFRGIQDMSALERLGPNGLRERRFVIVGYGNIQSGIEDDDGTVHGDMLIEALSRLQPDAIIIDEAHAIKNSNVRSDRILSLAQFQSVKHRLMLTATPYENNPNEVARLATLLDPGMFPTEDVFHALCRGNPRVFFALMSQRMCDYFAQDDVLDLPPSNFSTFAFFPHVRLEPTPELMAVHEAIQNDGSIEVRQQVLRMTQFLTVPYVGRDWYPDVGRLACFRDPFANPKLAYLRNAVGELIKTGKVVIVSGIYASGITRKLADAQDDPTVYEIATLFERWFPGQVLRFDAAANANGGRATIVHEWRNAAAARIMVVSLQAAAESLNFTLRREPSVEKLTIFYLSLPWKATQYHQFNGRYHRTGTEVPLDVFTLTFEGTADEALLELNERKWRNFLIGIHGVQILTVEEEALERATFERLVMTPARWLREAFGRMLGMGEAGIEKFLRGTLKHLPIAQTIAEYYLAVEETGPSGHVGRFVTPIIQQWKRDGVIRDWEDVFDGGCGTVVLERLLSAPVFALDINQFMIDVGKAHSYHGGKNAVQGKLSELPEEWTVRFRLAVFSIVLHLTSSKANRGRMVERVRILREAHRTLKHDGLLWCIVPSFCFDFESFGLFLDAVKRFGFDPVDALTGRVDALDHVEHPFACWSMLFRKKGEPDARGLSCPLFVFEQEREGRPRRKGKARKQERPPTPVAVRHERFLLTDTGGKTRELAHVAREIAGNGIDLKGLHQAMIRRFKIQERFLADQMRKALLEEHPRNWTELKEVWRTRIRLIPRAPKIGWERLRRIAKPYFGKS